MQKNAESPAGNDVESTSPAAGAKQRKPSNDVFYKFFDELTATANKNISDKLNSVVTTLASNKGDIGDICDQLCLDYSFLYFIQNRKRAYPTDRLGIFCEKYANMSCHELALGVRKPVMLPKIQSSIARTLIRLDSLFDISKVIINKYAPLATKAAHGPSRTDLTLSRIRELANDLQLTPMRAQALYWGNADNISLLFQPSHKNSIVRRIEKRNNAFVKMTTAIMAAFLVDQPLDYLICEDYTRTCEIAYRGDNGEPIVITDPKIIRVISIYLALPEDKQCEMFADILLRDLQFSVAFSSIFQF